MACIGWYKVLLRDFNCSFTLIILLGVIGGDVGAGT